MKRIITSSLILILLSVCFTVFAATPKALSLRHIDKLDRDVTFLGLGALELGRDWGIGLGKDAQHPPENVAQQTLETALQRGISVIDTSNAYHLSEELIGKYATPYKNKFLLITKTGQESVLAQDTRCKSPAANSPFCNDPASSYDFSRAGIRRHVAASLQRLKLKTLDVVLLHFSPDPQQVTNILNKGEAVAALKELQREGKIHYIGISTDGDLARRCIESNEFDVIELEYNLLNQTNKNNIALAHAKGMGVIVRGGLGTGLLTYKVAPYLSDPQLPYAKPIKALLNLVNGDFDKLTALELAFLYQNKNISSVIVGADNPEHLLNDINWIDNFNDPKLLKRAEKLMSQYPSGPFTYRLAKEGWRK
jgi:aryl-alcohol dehydrogenase-like predicted oxidoreductase